jgi:peptidoglycan hydrolase-like protein with peptidoglycan-binding domain
MQGEGQRGEQSAARAESQSAEGGVPLKQLSKDQIQNLQRQLQERALYFGSVDGIAGPKTKSALKNYQTQQGLQASENITPETAESLGLRWEEIERQPVRGTEGQQGQSAEQSQAESATEGQSARSAEMGTNLSELDSEQVQKLQQRLHELGFYKGSVDGIVGPQTRSALQRYFRDQAQLASRGKISDSALGAFGIEESELQPTRGFEQGEPQRQPGAGESEPGAGESMSPQAPQQQPATEPSPGEGSQGQDLPEGEGQQQY